MVASDSRPIEKAPPEARRLLGVLLRQRRAELGYTHRPAFARARLPLTDSGNPNTRLVADIEEAYRDNFPGPRLRQLARAYEVTYESVLAIAHSEATALIPAPPAAPAVPAEPAGRMPPFADPARIAAARPYYDQIRGRLDLLRAQGTAEPSGRQLFPDAPADARDWDGVGARLDADARVWLIAELRAGEDARAAGSRAGAAGA